MKRWSLVAVVLCLMVAGSAHAQNAPLAVQSSAALEGTHVFSGAQLSALTVTWHTNAARWLEIFDATAVPGNGAVTPIFCSFVQNSNQQTDGSQSYDWNFHPIQVRTGVAVALSTNASGCFNLTADGTNDRFDAQVR